MKISRGIGRETTEPPSSDAPSWRLRQGIAANAGNTLVGAASLGTVGLDWQLGGFAADPPTSSMGSSDGQPGSTAQLVQAMAGFGGGSGAADSLNIAPLGADTSQQSLLTTPQHA